MNTLRKRVQALTLCFMLGVPVILLAMILVYYKLEVGFSFSLFCGFGLSWILFRLTDSLGGKVEDIDHKLDQSISGSASHVAIASGFAVILLGNFFVAFYSRYSKNDFVLDSNVVYSVALLGLIAMVLVNSVARLFLYRSYLENNTIPESGSKKEKRKFDIEEIYSLAMLGLVCFGAPLVVFMVKVMLWAWDTRGIDVFWLSVEVMFFLLLLLSVFRLVALFVRSSERPKFYRTISLVASRQSIMFTIALFWLWLFGIWSFNSKIMVLGLEARVLDFFLLAAVATKLISRAVLVLHMFRRYGYEADSEEVSKKIGNRLFFWELSDMGSEQKFSFYSLMWLLSLLAGTLAAKIFMGVNQEYLISGLLHLPKPFLLIFLQSFLVMFVKKIFWPGKLDERDADIVKSADRNAVVVAFGLLLLCLVYFQVTDWKKEELYMLSSSLYELIIFSLVVLVLVRSATVLYLYRKFGEG